VNSDTTDITEKENLLDCLDGGLEQSLDANHCASFALKVLETSEGHLFRLRFIIDYTIDDKEKVQEKIFSRAFSVYSNRKKNIKGN
jgi:hypothetical protein